MTKKPDKHPAKSLTNWLALLAGVPTIGPFIPVLSTLLDVLNVNGAPSGIAAIYGVILVLATWYGRWRAGGLSTPKAIEYLITLAR